MYKRGGTSIKDVKMYSVHFQRGRYAPPLVNSGDPENCFEEVRLNECRASGTWHLAQCGACALLSSLPERERETVLCIICKTWKPACGPPHGFSPNLCRQWLDGAMKVYRAVCYQCQYPSCTVCKGRPDFPPPHNSRGGKGNFMCEKCRWPPCAGCGVVPRPVSTKYNVDNMKEWYCKTCSEKSCFDCGTAIKALQNGKHILREHEKHPEQRLVRTTCNYPRCVVCKKGERPRQALK